MTTPQNHKTKALSVKQTWGKRCNILLFMSSEIGVLLRVIFSQFSHPRSLRTLFSSKDTTLPTVPLAVREGRNQLWGKTRESFRYIWNHYRDEADWFLKADDDTYVNRIHTTGYKNTKYDLIVRYVSVENLRYFLSGFNSSAPLWFGHKYKAFIKNGYFSGGAGKVITFTFHKM